LKSVNIQVFHYIALHGSSSNAHSRDIIGVQHYSQAYDS